MVAYRTSDIQMNWQHPHKGDMGGAPLTCGYVKEGLGKLFTLTTSGIWNNSMSYYLHKF